LQTQHPKPSNNHHSTKLQTANPTSVNQHANSKNVELEKQRNPKKKTRKQQKQIEQVKPETQHAWKQLICRVSGVYSPMVGPSSDRVNKIFLAKAKYKKKFLVTYMSRAIV
jgi:hypothetical protein